MRYYIKHNNQKIYFPFNYEGFKQAQIYVDLHNLKNRKLHVEKI